MYNDASSLSESDHIKQYAPNDSGAHGATSGLAKLLKLVKHIRIDRPYKLLHQADWILYKLGAPLAITDYNNALKTGYDPIHLCWPKWIAKLTSLDVLPKVVAPGTIIGKLSKHLTARLSLPHSPDIVAGTTDSIAALIATGVTNVGDAVTSLGSSLVLKLIANKPLFVPQQGIYSHRLGHKWLISGASNTGGAVLRHFFSDQQLQVLSEQIDLSQTPEDYYPLLSQGERFPILDPLLAPRLEPRPDSDSAFLHGLLNGIANIEAKGYQLLTQSDTAKLNAIYSVGGGANNQIWQTIRQQKISVPFILPQQTEAAYGTALLARDRLQQF
jgi:xylulokinase